MSNPFTLDHGYLNFLSVYSLELHLAILTCIVAVAVIFDVRDHRIPNWLIALGLLAGVVHHAWSPLGQGLAFMLAGLVVGMLALMPLYAIGTMGAGDVKLMGLVGAFVGMADVTSAVVATFIAGGVLAILTVAYKRRLPELISNLHTMLIHRHIKKMGGAEANSLTPPPSVGKMPYAVAIAAGTAIQIFMLRR